jgi:predicted transcriptional regulator
LKGTYTTDYDIVVAQSFVIAHFKKRHILVDEIKSELALLDRKKVVSEIERLEKLRKTELLQDKIKRYTNEQDQIDYVNLTQPLVDAYKKTNKGAEEEQERIRLIEGFLEITSRYIPVDVVRVKTLKMNCTLCSFNMKDVEVNENGTKVCPRCGCERTVFHETKSSIVSVSVHAKDDLGNFKRQIIKTRGGQSIRFDRTKLFAQLDTYFRTRGWPTSADVRELPLKDGRRGPFTLQKIYDALYTTGNSEYYDDDVLIAQLYWGWAKPPLEAYDDQLEQDYITTQKIVDHLRFGDDRSSINLRVRTFFHYAARGIRIDTTGAKTVSTPETIDYYNDLWREVSAIMVAEHDPTWKYVPLPKN